MRNKNVVLSVTGIVALAVIFLVADWVMRPATSLSTNERASLAYERLVNDQGGVTVSVEPERIAQGGEWIFKISLDTHSVDLTGDLQKSVVIRTLDGRVYEPISAQSSPPGDHHRSGMVTFAAIDPYPSRIEVIVKDVGEVRERVFSWSVRD